MSYFKIVYKTTQNEIYELVIKNAFAFVANAENIALVNTAANNILTANAIDTGKGDLLSIDSITYHTDDTRVFDVI